MTELNKFELAIAASGCTKAKAREIIGLNSWEAFDTRLNHPESFRLGEIRLLKENLSENGLKILNEAIEDFFCRVD